MVETSMRIGLAGLQAAQKQATIRSSNIVNAFTPGYRAQEPQQVNTAGGPQVTVSTSTRPTTQLLSDGTQAEFSNVNLAEEFVGLKQAELAYKASAAVLRSAMERSDELLNAFDRGRDTDTKA